MMQMRFLKKNIEESFCWNKFEELIKNRLIKKWKYCENEDALNKYIAFKNETILKKKFSIWVQDEVAFEISKRTNRILMLPWERFRMRLEEFLHDWQKMCWFLNSDWDVKLYEMRWNSWIDFLEMLLEFKKTIKKDELQVIVIDNNAIHYTIEVLIECIKSWILLIGLPRYSPQLNPIEQLRKILKRYWRMKYSKLLDMISWIKEYTLSNNFHGLIENYLLKFFAPVL